MHYFQTNRIRSMLRPQPARPDEGQNVKTPQKVNRNSSARRGRAKPQVAGTSGIAYAPNAPGRRQARAAWTGGEVGLRPLPEGTAARGAGDAAHAGRRHGVQCQPRPGGGRGRRLCGGRAPGGGRASTRNGRAVPRFEASGKGHRGLTDRLEDARQIGERHTENAARGPGFAGRAGGGRRPSRFRGGLWVPHSRP